VHVVEGNATYTTALMAVGGISPFAIDGIVQRCSKRQTAGDRHRRRPTNAPNSLVFLVIANGNDSGNNKRVGSTRLAT